MRNIDLETEGVEAVKAAFDQSLVIDLTSEDHPDLAPVYGVRLGRSSHGKNLAREAGLLRTLVRPCL